MAIATRWLSRAGGPAGDLAEQSSLRQAGLSCPGALGQSQVPVWAPNGPQTFFLLLPTQRDQQQVGAFPGLGLRTLSPSVALLTTVWAWDLSWVGSAPQLGHRMGRGFGELSPTPEVLASPAPALSQVEIKELSMKHQQGQRLHEHPLTHVHTGKSCNT